MQGSLLSSLEAPPSPQPAPSRAHPPAPAPLAERMRPRTLEEYLGQEHLVGEGHLLRQLLGRDTLPSLVLWGPPGTGKTTLARLLAASPSWHLAEVSAVLAGVKDLREAIDAARQRRAMGGARTLLFVDEVHRFNKAQQDLLLPHIERGVVTLIGATTENPSFAINAALLSRCRVLRLEPLPHHALNALLDRALTDPERGLGQRTGLALAPEARQRLLERADGDARALLTTLEIAALQTPDPDDGAPPIIGLHELEEALQRPVLPYDAQGEHHYNFASALIKSLRGSDPDAALYYAARMIESGEDPLFILRRLVIFASEDVGNADPTALQLATSAAAAFQLVGMPEGGLHISQAITYLASAPKSNAVIQAWKLAQQDVRDAGNLAPPPRITNAPTALMRAHGYGEGYRYPHDAPGHFVPEHYLPTPLQGRIYYQPSDQGFELTLRQRLARWRALRDRDEDTPSGA